MHLPTPLVKSLLMAASIGLVVPILAQPSVVARKPAADKSADQPPAEVVGVSRAWAGGLLGLAVEGNAFVLRFYDAEKTPISPLAVRAAVRWNPVLKTGDERTVLNRSGELLRSPAIVRPPHVFTAYVTLLDADGAAVANVQFDFRELPAAATQ